MHGWCGGTWQFRPGNHVREEEVLLCVVKTSLFRLIVQLSLVFYDGNWARRDSCLLDSR